MPSGDVKATSKLEPQHGKHLVSLVTQDEEADEKPLMKIVVVETEKEIHPTVTTGEAPVKTVKKKKKKKTKKEN